MSPGNETLKPLEHFQKLFQIHQGYHTAFMNHSHISFLPSQQELFQFFANEMH